MCVWGSHRRTDTKDMQMSDLRESAREEPIEGLGEDEDEGLGDYPIDTLLIRQETRTTHDIVRRIDKGSFVMDPELQREFIWDVEHGDYSKRAGPSSSARIKGARSSRTICHTICHTMSRSTESYPWINRLRNPMTARHGTPE